MSDLNNCKTGFQQYDERQTVTGLRVNQIVNVDRRYIRTTRSMIFTLSRKYLEDRLWVVCFKGVEGVNLNEELVLASAFMTTGNKLWTAYHTFYKARFPRYCYVYRIKEKKYKAKIKSFCELSDTALLEIVSRDEDFESLKFAPYKPLYSGYKILTVGFPQLMPGHDPFTTLKAEIINKFIKSKLQYYEVSSDYHGGISGAPVLNKFNQVVGMALTGITATIDGENNSPVIEGNNSFISANHFLETKKSEQSSR